MHTVTSDNGKEFAKHESIAKNLDAHFFFAHPYASWERGLNENTNGLIRQYFSKKNSTISRISKSSRWWKNSITVQVNAWEWKHQISDSLRIIHLSQFGIESALNYFFLYQHLLSPSASVFLFRSCRFFRGLKVQISRVDAHLVLISHLHSSAGLAPSQGHPKFPQVFVYLISHTCLYFRRKYHEQKNDKPSDRGPGPQGQAPWRIL